MGRYLDSLTAQFDEITEGIEETLNRAADEGREVTTEEAQLVERDQARAEELKKSIEHYAGIEVTRAKVGDLRSKVPVSAQRSTTVVVEREKDPDVVLREAFPTAGDYLVTAGKALRGDKAAQEKILEVHRATAHQTLADNPGIVPRPIIGPVVDPLIASRPFISSIAQQALVAPAFDRPHITQHVAVGKQAAEKQLTESQKLLLGKLPVTAATFAGHVNISRQDIKWSQPGVLQIIAQDFAKIYALETDEEAVTSFVTSVSGVEPIDVDAFTAQALYAAIYGAAAASVTAKGPLPDTLWVSPDVWGGLGSLLNAFGAPVFPSMTPESTTGNPLGLKLVVDPFFVPNTAILGPWQFAEWYEDIDGFMTVEEPDVLGQLVGYAGYGAFLNTAPELFRPLALPVPDPGLAAAEPAKSSK